MNTLLAESPAAPMIRRTDDDVQNPRSAIVKKWLKRIDKAEKKWETKFKEMRDNMNFVAGWQWEGQTNLDDPRYINNLTLRMVNQKVAGLYARNPMASVVRRERLDYVLWDGEMESILQAAQVIQQSMMTGMMPDRKSVV